MVFDYSNFFACHSVHVGLHYHWQYTVIFISRLRLLNCNTYVLTMPLLKLNRDYELPLEQIIIYCVSYQVASVIQTILCTRRMLSISATWFHMADVNLIFMRRSYHSKVNEFNKFQQFCLCICLVHIYDWIFMYVCVCMLSPKTNDN